MYVITKISLLCSHFTSVSFLVSISIQWCWCLVMDPGCFTMECATWARIFFQFFCIFKCAEVAKNLQKNHQIWQKYWKTWKNPCYSSCTQLISGIDCKYPEPSLMMPKSFVFNGASIHTYLINDNLGFFLISLCIHEHQLFSLFYE